MGRRMLVIGLVLLAACQTSSTPSEVLGSAPNGTPASTSTSTALTTTSSASAPLDGSLAELRDLAFAYWEAFNAYEIEQVLAYLETQYRLEREEGITEEIGRLSTFGVKLGISESSPPVLLAPDRAEMYIEMRDPLGLRRIRMGFLLVEGDWVIDFAEESE